MPPVDSFNLQPPGLGPQRPVYPHLLQDIYINGGTVVGPSGNPASPTVGPVLYTGLVQQTHPTTLIPRSREPCLVVDVNENGLDIGYYDGRLVGSFNGLPVYTVKEKVPGDYYNLSNVTNVCPIFTSTLTIDGVVRTVSPPVVVGLTVERRTVRLSTSATASEVFCQNNPISCCEGFSIGIGSGQLSGSGSSGSGPNNTCCSPMPPLSLWALKVINAVATAGVCDCLTTCVHMVYNAGLDGWYSTAPIGLTCPGSAPTSFFRLRCRGGLWQWDVVSAGDVLLIRGITFGVVCSPFSISGRWDDRVTHNVLCGQVFQYLVTEVNCTSSGSGSSGSGSSGGGSVVTACCPGGIPTTLHATFGGALAGLGTVTLTYDTGTSVWAVTLTGTPCGDVTINFLCQFDGKFAMSILGGSQTGVSATAVSCSPLQWSATGTSTGTCAGAFSVAVAP